MLVMAALVAAACGSDDGGSTASRASTASSDVASAPSTSSTSTTSTFSSTSTTEQDTSTPSTEDVAAPPTAVTVGEPLADWITTQEAAGRTRGDVVLEAVTEARLVVAYAANAPANVAGGVLLADGHVIDLPDDTSTTRWPYLTALGRRPVIVSEIEGEYSLWQLSADASTWSEPVGLGVFAEPQGLPFVALLGDLLVVANQSVKDVGNGFYEPDRFEGVIVSDTLDVTPMAEPPERQFLSVTSTIRNHALMLGLDSAADANAPLTQPWDFDVSTNAWTEVPIPDWLDCGTTCNWGALHEFGDRHLEVVVGDRVVKRLPDGSIGVYEPDTGQWTRVQDAPFDLASPAVVVLGDQLAVAPVFTGYGENLAGTVGVLDLATGTWRSDTVDVGVIPEFGYQAWEAHGDGTVALFDVIHPEQVPPDPSAPDLAYDSITREWRVPTADEAAQWTRLGGGAIAGSGSLRDLLLPSP